MALKGLDIAVLVNNVGQSYNFPVYFDELTDEQVSQSVSASVRPRPSATLTRHDQLWLLSVTSTAESCSIVRICTWFLGPPSSSRVLSLYRSSRCWS